MNVDTSGEKISALVLSKNEEKVIARCLASLTWADEIILVDAQSTDDTRKIACDPEASWAGKLRFLERTWSGFREQREFAMKESANDWVLFVDADEECTPELAAKVRAVIADPALRKFRYFKVRRIEYFLGKPIRYGMWNPSYQDRFFHRAGVKYVNDIHEYPAFPTPPQSIHEPLNHWPDFHPERFLEKMNKYTTIEARDRVARGQRTNAFRVVMAFPAMFLKNYFYYSAWKDGSHGLIISVLEGVSRAVRHVKIWQFSREKAALSRTP